MYLKLLTFEWKYQSRKLVNIGFACFFLLMGFTSGSYSSGAPANNFINNPYWLNFYTGLATLIALFVMMFATAFALLRDQQYQMEALVYSTPIRKVTFFFSRFLGAFLANVAIVGMFIIGFMLASQLASLPAERFDAFQLSPYLSAFTLFILPNTFICLSILCLVAVLTRKAIALYAAAIALYGLYFISAIFLNSPLLANSVPASTESMALAALADPLGLSAFFEQTQYWAAHQRNTQLLSFSGLLLANRLIWLSVGAAFLALAYYRFSFRMIGAKPQKKPVEATKSLAKIPYQMVATYAQTFSGKLSAFNALFRMEWAGMVKSLPFLGMLLAWVVIVFMESYARINGGGQYGTDMYPTTNLMIWLIKDPLSIIGLLLLVFYSGELVWRDRSTHFHELLGATPVGNSTIFLSKYLSLASIPFTLMLVGIIISIALQISKAYYYIELDLYLGFMYFSGLQLLLIGLFAMFVQTLSPNKYVGMLFSVFILVFFNPQIASLIGLEHPLFHFAYLPRISHTDMAGYRNIAEFQAFALYWSAILGLMVLIAYKVWQRGTQRPFLQQLITLTQSWTQREAFVALTFLGIFLSAGSYIFYQKNIVDTYRSSSDRLHYKARYEREYKKYEHFPKISVTSVNTKVDIFPETCALQFSANYILENTNEQAIDSIFVSEQFPLASLQIEQADLLFYDSLVGAYLFKLNKPLEKGQQLQLHYKIKAGGKTFNPFISLVNNGIYIRHRLIEPRLFYSGLHEIRDPLKRQKYGLAPKIHEVLNDDHLSKDASWDDRDVDFETVISTKKSHTALVQGNLVKKWEEDNRAYYHYKTKHKTKRNINYFSAEYEQVVEKYEGVSIELYYHKSHPYNIAHIMELAKHSLDYGNKHFGAYAEDHLRIAEIPNHWPFGGQAMPGTISMTERGMYLVDLRNPPKIDLVARRVIHEIAHQWWGHQLTPKLIEGAGTLNESLSKYTEVAVIQQLYGKTMLRELADYSSEEYFRHRAQAAEAEESLHLVSKQRFLVYHKGFVVMHALRELLGEEQVNKALSQLIQQYSDTAQRRATSLDLIQALYEVAPKANHSLINDWLKKSITYDLKIAESSMKQLADGTYEIRAKIIAKRFESQQDEAPKEIGISEMLQIGLFTKHPSELKKDEQPVLLQHYQFDESTKEIVLLVNERPTYLAIDPYVTRLDANRVDNLEELE